MGLAAGKLDRKIRLERATYTRNPGSGEQVPTWGLLRRLSAMWRPASSRETLAAAEVQATVTDVFVIRYDSAWADLNAKDRLIFDGRTYDIAGVVEDPDYGRRVALRITAHARADQ